MGELTNQFVLKSKADIVYTSLDDRAPMNYARIPGYLSCYQKDQSTLRGGVVFSHKLTLYVHIFYVTLTEEMEIILWKLIDGQEKGYSAVVPTAHQLKPLN